jgi:hypothetical protein
VSADALNAVAVAGAVVGAAVLLVFFFWPRG